MPTIESLHVYPVKSCGGIAVQSATIGKYGFLRDREWIVVAESGEKLTQREQPRLALVHTSLTDETLRLSAEGYGGVEVSLAAVPHHKQRVNVWGDDTPGLIETQEACTWMSDYLGTKAKLLRFDFSGSREVGETWGGESGANIVFCDCTPLHVTTLASLAVLNDWRLEQGLDLSPMDRFRPNIVLSGTEAWDEDAWPALFGPDGIQLDVVRPTSRCRTTLVDQQSGTVEETGNLHVLTKKRLFKNYVGKQGAFFGVQTLVLGCEGKDLCVGDGLTVGPQRAGLPAVPRLF